MISMHSPIKSRQVWDKDWYQQVEHMQVPNWTGLGVRGERPMSACHVRSRNKSFNYEWAVYWISLHGSTIIYKAMRVKIAFYIFISEVICYQKKTYKSKDLGKNNIRIERFSDLCQLTCHTAAHLLYYPSIL